MSASTQLPGDSAAQPQRARRAFIETLLGIGIVASLASFLYPILRYVIPPPSTDLGADEVVAAQVGALKPNTGKIFRFILRAHCAEHVEQFVVLV